MKGVNEKTVRILLNVNISVEDGIPMPDNDKIKDMLLDCFRQSDLTGFFHPSTTVGIETSSVIEEGDHQQIVLEPAK